MIMVPGNRVELNFTGTGVFIVIIHSNRFKGMERIAPVNSQGGVESASIGGNHGETGNGWDPFPPY